MPGVQDGNDIVSAEEFLAQLHAVNGKASKKSAGENFIELFSERLRDFSPTTTPKSELARRLGKESAHGSTTSFPTTTSNHGSNHGSRSGSSDGNKHDRSANEDGAADVEAADGPPQASNGRAFDPDLEAPVLPLNKFQREMTDCLQELLDAQKYAPEVPPMPPMPDPFAFQDFSVPSSEVPEEKKKKKRKKKYSEVPAEQPPAAEAAEPHVQYVPVPFISTPYGFCPLPLPPLPMPFNFMPLQPQPGYVHHPTEEELAQAAAACPPGFTLKPAADVLEESLALLQTRAASAARASAPPGVSPKADDLVEEDAAAPASSKGFGLNLEELLPHGRQREPRLCEDANRKVFVGGLNPATTSEDLRTYFERFGTVAEATVVIDKVKRVSRGFGFVMFEGGIPEGLLDKQHIIGSRRCGVRDYGGARENEPSA